MSPPPPSTRGLVKYCRLCRAKCLLTAISERGTIGSVLVCKLNRSLLIELGGEVRGEAEAELHFNWDLIVTTTTPKARCNIAAATSDDRSASSAVIALTWSSHAIQAPARRWKCKINTEGTLWQTPLFHSFSVKC